MRKILLLLLIGTLPSLSFANDALEPPRGMLRLSETTSFSFAVKEFNLDGEKINIPVNGGRFAAMNLGAAIELGITNWLSAAVRWTPGWNIWSAFDFQTSPDDMLTANGPYDLHAEARFQIVGQQGLLRSDRLRLALAPVGKIALPPPDWQEQANRALDGKHWTQFTNDYRTPGIGGRAYFDLVLNRLSYVNLYAEFIRYFPKDYADYNLLTYQQLPPKPKEIDFGYVLVTEAEPHLEFLISEGMRIGAGIPVTYRKTPELKADGIAAADSDTYRLSVSPTLILHLSKPALEFRLGYTYPILGKGKPDAPEALAMNSLSLQVRSYLRIFK